MRNACLIWRWLAQALADQKPAVLVIVVDSRGSAPGKLGDKMAVIEDGVIGSVGGGILEHAALHKAREMLRQQAESPQWMHRVHAHHHAEASGAVCGGEQTLLFYRCQPMERAVFQRLSDDTLSSNPGVLVLSTEGLKLTSALADDADVSYQVGSLWCYRERYDKQPRAYIIGAGHVGQALAKVLELLGFLIMLIDERPVAELSQHSELTWPHHQISYEKISRQIPEGSHHFVFIMTHSHQRDALVCRQLLAKNFAYIGVLGSRTKLECLKTSLIEHIPELLLQRLHAPMGLPINSHSPAEIAVSIAAEVVHCLSGGQSVRHFVSSGENP